MNEEAEWVTITDVEEFDIDAVHVEPKLENIDIWQEGNYIVGSNNGSMFRHRIPAGKTLDKKDGKYILKDQ